MTESNIGAPFDLSTWQANCAAQQKLREDIRHRNKAALFDALAAAAVTRVVVSFNGYGDSGQVENIEATAGGVPVALPGGEIEILTLPWAWGESEPVAEPDRSTLTVAGAIEQLAYDFLEETHAGWEINEGAFGEFTFDVALRTITLDYNERIETSENHQHEF